MNRAPVGAGEFYFGDNNEDLVILRVPKSNTANRGMVLGYWGSLRGHWGTHRCPRGIQGGVCLAPFAALLVPLEISKGIRSGFKDYMMVQLANIHWAVLIDLV